MYCRRNTGACTFTDWNRLEVPIDKFYFIHVEDTCLAYSHAALRLQEIGGLMILFLEICLNEMIANKINECRCILDIETYSRYGEYGT
jgi:hypothetical protein